MLAVSPTDPSPLLHPVPSPLPCCGFPGAACYTRAAWRSASNPLPPWSRNGCSWVGPVAAASSTQLLPLPLWIFCLAATQRLLACLRAPARAQFWERRGCGAGCHRRLSWGPRDAAAGGGPAAGGGLAGAPINRLRLLHLPRARACACHMPCRRMRMPCRCLWKRRGCHFKPPFFSSRPADVWSGA